MKLQDAYISESGTGIGDWKLIGYKMASTSNFKYYEGTTEGGLTAGTSVELSTGKATAWKATNNAALNDCAANGSWILDISANTTSGGSASYVAKVSSADCNALTPSFGKLATSGTVTIAQ